jgi:myo-inositol-1(or 4)-monophosphatase
MEYKKLCDEVIQAAKDVGKYITSERNKFSQSKIQAKGTHNFVTYVDKNSEEKLITILEKLIPDCGFIAEEGTKKSEQKEFTWIIDPLDGTTNFIHGSPPYSISIALMKENSLVMGVVYEITLQECFYSYKGGSVYLNGKEIKVSETTLLKESLIATGFPYHNYGRLEPFMKSLEYLFVNTHGVRRLGSAATDLAYVACGRYDGFYEYNLSPWDVSAGAYLVQQAGGMVTDFKAGDDFIFGKEVVAANASMHQEFLNCVAGFMNQ